MRLPMNVMIFYCKVSFLKIKTNTDMYLMCTEKYFSSNYELTY